ncbi:hypothetical protein MA16_Dca021094 [Dendrobium catenatum]|uniref:Uncharacterized protein n=1 Tax=Dendrobium catenatum TaxID=906689 RepID=A0A2I0VXX7_9ASPA|nr:hypothetical protein MA16_Dca021094 [Dendrobium catenatum]
MSNGDFSTRLPKASPLVIREYVAIIIKESTVVDVKGKDIVAKFEFKAPQFSKSPVLKNTDFVASSSEMKIFINRFGSFNDMPEGNLIVEENRCSMLVNGETDPIFVEVSSDNGREGSNLLNNIKESFVNKVDNKSVVNPFSRNSYIKIKFKDEESLLIADGVAVKLHAPRLLSVTRFLSDARLLPVVGFLLDAKLSPVGRIMSAIGLSSDFYLIPVFCPLPDLCRIFFELLHDARLPHVIELLPVTRLSLYFHLTSDFCRLPDFHPLSDFCHSLDFFFLILLDVGLSLVTGFLPDDGLSPIVEFMLIARLSSDFYPTPEFCPSLNFFKSHDFRGTST